MNPSSKNGPAYPAGQDDPHEPYRELCALATTGELSHEEWQRLEEHLAGCGDCRALLEEYEQLAGSMTPARATEWSSAGGEIAAPDTWSLDNAEQALRQTLAYEPVPIAIEPAKPRIRLWPFAVAALVLLGTGFVSYWAGENYGQPASRASEAKPLARIVRPAVPSVPGGKAAAEAAQLRAALSGSRAETAKLREQRDQLEAELEKGTADLARARAEREGLNQQLAAAETSAQNLRDRLSLVSGQSAQDAADLQGLQAQINTLNTALDARDREIAHQEALLDRDRDIRNLISARNLYIAEIYDVAKNGDTQKPFGRVFYTKDKSLVFYGYDLDQQRNLPKDAVFQAWGRSGVDQEHDISLGLLYQDDAHQKRWVLKSKDAKSIAQIDAIFVTAEPEGGSAKPTGKPLLFTYLKLDPNHP